MSLSLGGVMRRAKLVGVPDSDGCSAVFTRKHTLLGSSLDALASGVLTCPVVQRQGGGGGGG